MMRRLSIIIPTHSQADTVRALTTRIDAAFENDRSRYEIIFMSNSLAESIMHATYDTIAILEPGFDYPAEALPEMLRRVEDGADAVVANHRRPMPSFFHRLVSGILQYGYGETPLKRDVDIRSGLRMFKKDLATRTKMNPETNDFSGEFLLRLRRSGRIVVGYDSRAAISRIRSATSGARTAIEQRLAPNHYVEFNEGLQKNKGRGFHYKGREYVTHNSLTYRDSAVERTTLAQRLVLFVLLLLATAGVSAGGNILLVALVSLVTVLYFCDLLFNMFLIYRSLKQYSEIIVKDDAVARRRKWPAYTILCPLYKEALVVPQFIAAMQAIEYPKNKLEVLLLLEEDDMETIVAIKAMKLPRFFKTTVVPHSMPKTKPKACNYGLLRAGGEYSVIYDAEDIPDTLQLKKAVVAFERVGMDIGCIQAKLNYYNWNQNLLTRLFTLEYSLWFNLILTGLQSIRAPIPLGGTSNHFRTSVLRELGGWDPFNVTEDADLGIRLAKRGLKTAVLDSTTLEEANSALGNWLKQRSRWIKGYMQTYLVHMRDVREFGKNSRRIDMITFQLVIGGKVVSMLINPVLWAMTIGYFAYRPQIGPFIESLYLAPVFYVGAFSLIVGNFLYLYYYMIGAAREGRPELIIFAVFVPFYWLMMSMAAVFALYDLLVRPFHWHKTKHGLHLKKNPASEGAV